MRHEKFNMPSIEAQIVQIEKDLDIIQTIPTNNGTIHFLMRECMERLTQAEGLLHEAAELALDQVEYVG
ncbi:MAG: hypothetical protein P4L79_10065 [Legionella sp.]|uniref:hypothetical protein n=1 Tax=Legionella sp. TaxID=459 RepID=UPI00283BC52A|nr:hypothetical protein [Legionella sp.]